MKKLIIIPDSFKGSIPSTQFCDIVEAAFVAHFPTLEIIKLPVADGGEGTVSAFLAAVGGRRVEVEVTGPLFTAVPAFYGVLPDGTAVIEVAAAAGLPLAKGTGTAASTTTYGVGEILAHALKSGCRNFIIGLGGTASNDFACGMAAALGAVFTSGEGRQFVPVGGTLNTVAHMELHALQSKIEGCHFTAICDVENPLLGPNGAAYVFGPQKGATAEELPLLDEGLKHIALLTKKTGLPDVRHMRGAGAAGGMGGGLIAFLGAELKMGAQVVLDAVGLETHLENATLLITGEGKLDSQSLNGKLVGAVAERAKAAGVPAIAMVGDIADGAEAVYDKGIAAVYSINRLAIPMSEAKKRSPQDLFYTADTLARTLKLSGRLYEV